MNCEFEIDDNTSIATCKVCGAKVKTRQTNPNRIARTCGAAPANPSGLTKNQPTKSKPRKRGPTLIQKMGNFTKAAISHALKGMPTCSQEQIDERLAICQKCPLFKQVGESPDIGTCIHKDCGCALNREKKFLNKIAWKTQSCPDKTNDKPEGRWQDVDEKYRDGTP